MARSRWPYAGPSSRGAASPPSGRPRAKALVELWGCRSRRSWGASTKKRVDLGSLFDIEHETTPSFVDGPQQRAFPKTRCGVTDRKASPDAPDFFLFSFGRVDPNTTRRHRQTPPIAPLLAHSNTPKNRRFSAGGAVHRPFRSGSVVMAMSE